MHSDTANSNADFRNIFENAPIGVFQSNATRLLRANPALARMFGYANSDEMVAEGVNPGPAFVRPEQRAEIIRRAVQEKAYVKEEVEYRRKDGSSFFANLWMRAVPDETGAVQFLEGFVEDITPRKRAEEQAAAAARYLHTLVQTLPIGIITYQAGGEVIAFNPLVAAMIGATPEQLTGQNFRQLESWRSSGLLAAAEAALQTGQPQRIEVHHASTFGKKSWLSVQFVPFPYQGETQLIGMFTDVTKDKQVEVEMQESEEKFRQLAENIEAVFWVADKEVSRIIYVSPAYERIWGASCQSLYDRPFSFAEAVHPDDRKKVMACLEQQRRGNRTEVEYRILRPDGTQRWIHDRSFIVRNAAGEFYRLAGIAEDITARKQLEIQFLQAQKMEAIGQLAGGVAHDFNNIIAATLLHLGVLQMNPDFSDATKDSLKELEQGAMQASSLTRQLLLFSRRQTAATKRLDLNALISNMQRMLGRLLGETIQVSVWSSETATWVEADAGMLEQVLMNLSVNARDAMPDGGKISISTTAVERDAESVQTNPAGRVGRFVCVSVSDTGSGMDEKVLKRIFEPFFTTKEAGKGTGLGLATVFGIVKQHQGWIEVDSVVGRGTTFRIYLPAAAISRDLPSTENRPPEIRGGSETILLAEDEMAVRRVTALCLRKLGYGVIEAENGPDALKQWQEHGQEVDILLTDMVMPEGMTGLDLATRLREDRPALPVIIASGYSADGLRTSAIAHEMTFLSKPFPRATLAKALRAQLDNAAMKAGRSGQPVQSNGNNL
jgi:PAS domain S-box-containing protein